MKRIMFYLYVAFIWIWAGTAKAQSKGYSPEIDSYVTFLRTQDSPVDYLMNLFEKYDIIILGERSHMDTTQYDLIEQIISDSRFIEKVGHVMTEVGCHNVTERANEVLTADYPDIDKFNKKVVHILRDADYITGWEKTNFYQLLRSIYQVNRHLQPKDKITITFTGPSFSWKMTAHMTPEQHSAWDESTYDSFDYILAENVINTVCGWYEADKPRKKALVIFNRPHSFRDKKAIWTPCAAQQIMARFPGKVANVMLHNCKWYDDKEQGYSQLAVQDGKWEAAYIAAGNRPVGFNLDGSPFGADWFDQFGNEKVIRDSVRYADVFTGYIIDRPYTQTVNAYGYPISFVDDEFEPELIRRSAFASPKPRTGEWLRKHFNTVKVSPIFENSIVEQEYKQAVARWLYK